MTGGLWWKRLVNSVRFLDDIQDTLVDDKSAMLLFDADIPWKDIMIETIEGRLADRIDNKTFDVLDVSAVDSPGTYLMERYCSNIGASSVQPGLSSTEISKQLISKVKEHFIETLGRPELLNRIGDNIVAFKQYGCCTYSNYG